ncbi:MAG TPA: acyl-CoA dehydrogenase family protein, partial [Candidatus Sulfotelmatobacter sp.]|nr:acyl-CoA dehydrogenase family protein [Candidatus Sulfotelmatobacter sp.]
MIDFELSEEQQMIRDSVGAFAREEIRPAARPADESGTIPAALISKAWQFGFVSGAIPEKFGGGGDARSAVTGAIVAEELGFGDISIALHVLAPRLFAFPIVEMGTDDQRAKYLKRFAGSDFAAATAAVMEPRFDFDLSAQ